MMVERTPLLDTFTYVFLMAGICVVGFPIFYAITAVTLPLDEVAKVPMPLAPGDQFFVNTQAAWDKGHLGRQLINSFIMAAGITLGKIVVSMLVAFSISMGWCSGSAATKLKLPSSGACSTVIPA